jgi:hypothetical protein
MTMLEGTGGVILGRRHLVKVPVLHIPLVIERGYRGAAETRHSLTFRRRVACACELAGCSRCDLVGWIVRTETIDVQVPAVADIGTALRLPGQGDAIVPNSPGDLAVEVVEEGERAEELRAAQRAQEAQLADAWEAARVERLSDRRQGKRFALRAFGALSVVVLVVGGFVLKKHFDKGEIGAQCATHEDCRSARCLSVQRALSLGELTQDGETPVPGRSLLAPIAERRVCTADCTRDADCPVAMKCGSARSTNLLAPNVAHIERACVPR